MHSASWPKSRTRTRPTPRSQTANQRILEEIFSPTEALNRVLEVVERVLEACGVGRASPPWVSLTRSAVIWKSARWAPRVGAGGARRMRACAVPTSTSARRSRRPRGCPRRARRNVCTTGQLVSPLRTASDIRSSERARIAPEARPCCPEREACCAIETPAGLFAGAPGGPQDAPTDAADRNAVSVAAMAASGRTAPHPRAPQSLRASSARTARSRTSDAVAHAPRENVRAATLPTTVTPDLLPGAFFQISTLSSRSATLGRPFVGRRRCLLRPFWPRITLSVTSTLVPTLLATTGRREAAIARRHALFVERP